MSILFDIFVLGPAALLVSKANDINRARMKNGGKGVKYLNDTSMECLAFDALNQQARDRQCQDHPEHYRYEEPDIDGLMNDNGPDW